LHCGGRRLVVDCAAGDRALLTWMTRLWPSLLGMAQVVQPETILRWHRAGFKAFWRWKSLNRTGRPKIDRGLRDLIQRMSRENPLWDGILCAYAAYYNQVRTHLALQKDAPLHRAVQRSGAIVAIPILGGLHHQYVRI
jgi:hypothetical protein